MKLTVLKSLHNYIKSIIWGLLIFFSGALPANKISRISLLHIKYADKLFHFLMYFIFSIIIYFDLRRNVKSLKSRYSVYSFMFLIPFVWGMIMEIIQHYLIASRAGSISDIIANISGIFTGILLILILDKNLLKD